MGKELATANADLRLRDRTGVSVLQLVQARSLSFRYMPSDFCQAVWPSEVLGCYGENMSARAHVAPVQSLRGGCYSWRALYVLVAPSYPVRYYVFGRLGGSQVEEEYRDKISPVTLGSSLTCSD